MSEWLTDRSRILDYQSCPRKRYLGYHYQGAGLQRKSKSLPLVFGGAFHEGVEILLRGPDASKHPDRVDAWGKDIVERAVVRAQLHLSLAFESSGVDLTNESAPYLMKEQAAMAEALLRGWWVYEGERFLSEFEVIEVEQEGRASLGDGITLLFRPDALVRERSSGDLYVVSWKTCSTYGQRQYEQAMTDMQSMSEVFGVQQRYLETVSGDDFGHFEELKIEGVLYKSIVKGTRRFDKFLNHQTQDSPLIYAWHRPGPTPDMDEWFHSYSYVGEDGKEHKLGKGWRKVAVWEKYPGGVKAWIDDLAAQRIMPTSINALEKVFPQSLPVSRRADEIESWKEQTVASEHRISRHIAYIGSDPSVRDLDVAFLQNTARCFDYSSRCQFYDICWTPAVKADPIGSGLYQIRTANHPEGEEE